MKKEYKLTDTELKKWINILTAKKILDLHMDSKIKLTSKQLDFTIEKKNNTTM